MTKGMRGLSRVGKKAKAKKPRPRIPSQEEIRRMAAESALQAELTRRAMDPPPSLAQALYQHLERKGQEPSND